MSKVSAISGATGDDLDQFRNISDVWNGAKSAISKILNDIQSVIKSVFKAIESIINSALNGIKNVTETVWKNINSIISGRLGTGATTSCRT